MRVFLAVFSLLIAGCGPLEVVDWCENTPILIRSPQPDYDDLSTLAMAHGLKTVINLRPHEEAGGGWYLNEVEDTRHLGINLITIDLGDGTLPPQDWQLHKYFGLVSDPKRWPVLIHCQAGIHRTGIMAALYRVQFQGWDNEQAIDEMESHWFDWSLEDRSKVKAFLRQFTPMTQYQIKRHECNK